MYDTYFYWDATFNLRPLFSAEHLSVYISLSRGCKKSVVYRAKREVLLLQMPSNSLEKTMKYLFKIAGHNTEVSKPLSFILAGIVKHTSRMDLHSSLFFMLHTISLKIDSFSSKESISSLICYSIFESTWDRYFPIMSGVLLQHYGSKCIKIHRERPKWTLSFSAALCQDVQTGFVPFFPISALSFPLLLFLCHGKYFRRLLYSWPG